MSAPDTRMLLQRKLPQGDCAKWRTVLRFGQRQVDDMAAFVAVAKRLDPDVAWRITAADGRPLA